MIPHSELVALTLTMADAMFLAAEDNIAEGYACLREGLERAAALSAQGEEWAAELAERYRAALGSYARNYALPGGAGPS